jgi:3'-phosphoadenosine 5'-phosphosulfate sulfotransferase (PAPS reductase)/FAD synthetase
VLGVGTENGGSEGDGVKHIVQYSGGAGSAMAAYLVTQTQPKKDIILLFHDVKGGHDEDMYRFNADVSEFLGLPITEYSLDKTMWDLVKAHHTIHGGQVLFRTPLFCVSPR